jgi:CRISPR-associated protein Cas2
MLVIIANDLPPAVRGRMKLWFVEPSPNVFVSGVKGHVAETVVAYLMSYCPAESGLVIFRSLRIAPGYEIRTKGPTRKMMTKLNGLQLVIEKQKIE